MKNDPRGRSQELAASDPVDAKELCARILLAEDDAEMRKLLTEALEAEGYEVVQAEHGAELFEHLSDTVFDERVGLFDLVISDIRMPWWSGMEVLEGLRSRDWRTPVILMTAFPGEETHENARKLGAIVFDKPFDLDELTAYVRSVVPPTEVSAPTQSGSG